MYTRAFKQCGTAYRGLDAEMIILFLIGAFAAAFIWEFYYRRHWIQNVTVRLWFETDALYAGDTTKLYEVIENRKAMPVPTLEVGFHTSRELDFADTENTNVSDHIYKRDVFAVLGRQKITREIPLTCRRRGHYDIKEADLTSYSLLYRRRYSHAFDISASIYVYPKMTDVSETIAMCERMLGTLQCSKRLYEDPFAFRTIRAYTTDDPMKTINWKASAKTGELMVNTFDSVMSPKAVVYLDVEDSGILKYEDLVEESISVSATIARKLLRRGIEVGFGFNGVLESGEYERCFAPCNQKSRLIALERMLADYRLENGSISYDKIFDDICPSDDTLLIFVTKNLTEAMLDNIRMFADGRRSLIVCPIRRGENKTYESVPFKDSMNIRVSYIEK